MDPGFWAARARFGTPGQLDPKLLWLFRRVVGPIVRLAHRPSLSGVEHLPDEGPYLLVANHSGAMAPSEIFSFVSLWLGHLGPDRRLAGFAHPFGFNFWPFSWALRSLGAIPSTYEHALATLDDGIPLLVFPGGDHESTRPIWQANTVTFGGRKGFLKIAREARVPIIPMGIRGSHYSVPILARSRLLAWLLVIPAVFGLKRVPLTVLGVAGAAAILGLAGPMLGWGWAALFTWLWFCTPLPMLPWVPSTIRMRIGPRLDSAELFGSEHDEDEARLDGAYQRVESAVQALVTNPR